MSTHPKIDLPFMDRASVTSRLFHPRPQLEYSNIEGGRNVFIHVDGADLHGRFFFTGRRAPTILLFHGNGEIAADYEEFAPDFMRLGMNLMVVDYRGYGRSTGLPRASDIIKDAHLILDFALDWLKEKDHRGPMIVMGRSLGSVCALELAVNRTDVIDGLVLESAFANTELLLDVLGMDWRAMGFSEEMGFCNLEKAAQVQVPTLVLHGELDQLLPLSEGKALYRACGSSSKILAPIPGGDHNDLFFVGKQKYLASIHSLGDRLVHAKSEEVSGG